MFRKVSSQVAAERLRTPALPASFQRFSFLANSAGAAFTLRVQTHGKIMIHIFVSDVVFLRMNIEEMAFKIRAKVAMTALFDDAFSIYVVTEGFSLGDLRVPFSYFVVITRLFLFLLLTVL